MMIVPSFDDIVGSAAFTARVQTLRHSMFSALSPAERADDGAAAGANSDGSSAVAASTALSLVPNRRPRDDVPSDAAQQAPRPQPVPTMSSAIVAVDPSVLRAQAEAKAAQSSTDGVSAIRPKWKIERVCVGHQGRVTSISMDVGNSWFVTGSADASVKAWDLVSGKCKATLTGHKAGVEAVAVSPLSPYLFSGGLDKVVKCWDLETNTVIRDYFGHLSAVYSVACHPSQDIIVTGGRDATVRVWDVRTSKAVWVLQGHQDEVFSVTAQATAPQVISGGADGFIYFWDLASGRPITRLTSHKKPVRAFAIHPVENTFVSAGADNVRKWRLPTGEFIRNMAPEVGHRNSGARWTCAAISPRDVLVVGADGGGALDFYDWPSGALFQSGATKSVPGTLPGEAGVLAVTFDRSGTRMLTAEGDKTVKFWGEVTPA
jgi:pleiotropic regulator 1